MIHWKRWKSKMSRLTQHRRRSSWSGLLTLASIEKALAKLPPRQREAFILRYWEEMDVAEAAKAMGCSEGSVKTHCSRATHALAETLKKLGITL